MPSSSPSYVNPQNLGHLRSAYATLNAKISGRLPSRQELLGQFNTLVTQRGGASLREKQFDTVCKEAKAFVQAGKAAKEYGCDYPLCAARRSTVYDRDLSSAHKTFRETFRNEDPTAKLLHRQVEISFPDASISLDAVTRRASGLSLSTTRDWPNFLIKMLLHTYPVELAAAKNSGLTHPTKEMLHTSIKALGLDTYFQFSEGDVQSALALLRKQDPSKAEWKLQTLRRPQLTSSQPAVLDGYIQYQREHGDFPRPEDLVALLETSSPQHFNAANVAKPRTLRDRAIKGLRQINKIHAQIGGKHLLLRGRKYADALIGLIPIEDQFRTSVERTGLNPHIDIPPALRKALTVKQLRPLHTAGSLSGSSITEAQEVLFMYMVVALCADTDKPRLAPELGQQLTEVETEFSRKFQSPQSANRFKGQLVTLYLAGAQGRINLPELPEFIKSNGDSLAELAAELHDGYRQILQKAEILKKK